MEDNQSRFWNSPLTSIAVFLVTILVLGLVYVFQLPDTDSAGSDDVLSGLPEPDLPFIQFPDSMGWAPPDWSMVDVSSDTLTFGALRGKVVVLNIWASWCFPCVVEMPALAELQERLGDDRFAVVLLGEEEPQAIERFSKREVVALPLYADASARPPLFQVPSLPVTFVIDPDGVLRGVQVGAVNWNHDPTISYLQSLAR